MWIFYIKLLEITIPRVFNYNPENTCPLHVQFILELLNPHRQEGFQKV